MSNRTSFPESMQGEVRCKRKSPLLGSANRGSCFVLPWPGQSIVLYSIVVAASLSKTCGRSLPQKIELVTCGLELFKLYMPPPSWSLAVFWAKVQWMIKGFDWKKLKMAPPLSTASLSTNRQFSMYGLDRRFRMAPPQLLARLAVKMHWVIFGSLPEILKMAPPSLPRARFSVNSHRAMAGLERQFSIAPPSQSLVFAMKRQSCTFKSLSTLNIAPPPWFQSCSMAAFSVKIQPVSLPETTLLNIAPPSEAVFWVKRQSVAQIEPELIYTAPPRWAVLDKKAHSIRNRSPDKAARAPPNRASFSSNRHHRIVGEPS